MNIKRRLLPIVAALGLVVSASAFAPHSVAASTCNGWFSFYTVDVGNSHYDVGMEQDFCTSDGYTWTWSGQPRYSITKLSNSSIATWSLSGKGVYNSSSSEVNSWVNLTEYTPANTTVYLYLRITFSRTGNPGSIVPYNYSNSSSNWGWQGQTTAYVLNRWNCLVSSCGVMVP